MQHITLKSLVLVAAVFFFTSNLSGSFLTIFLRETGFDVTEIAKILLFTFVIIGFLPCLLVKHVKNFERLISVGIFTTMIFYVLLIYLKNPVILGLFYGLSIATFWPSFNLLQFRLSEAKIRARTISLFSSIIPSIASIIGPITASIIITFADFTTLFIVAVGLYFLAFALCVRTRFQPEKQKFSVPKNRTFAIFFMTFIVLGFVETYWIAHPFFVYDISKSILNMGFVMTSTAIVTTIIYFLVNWFSDIKGSRASFTVLGVILNFAWYLAIAHATTMYDLIALAILSGTAGAFTLSWFAHYANCFSKEQYASILVLMEVGLMVGRILNLAPTIVFIAERDYASYYKLSGIVLLLLIPLCVASTRRNSRNQLQALSHTP
ncbi:MAG: MFS transporter [Candidatus Bathyarchaeia archaeon]